MLSQVERPVRLSVGVRCCAGAGNVSVARVVGILGGFEQGSPTGWYHHHQVVPPVVTTQKHKKTRILEIY